MTALYSSSGLHTVYTKTRDKTRKSSTLLVIISSQRTWSFDQLLTPRHSVVLFSCLKYKSNISAPSIFETHLHF